MSEVHAIKTEEDRQKFNSALVVHGDLYSDIWRFGLNCALRISDILALKKSQFTDEVLKEGELTITMIKTGLSYDLLLNPPMVEIIRRRILLGGGNSFLFHSLANRSRSSQKAISYGQVWRVFKAAGGEVGLTTNVGTHTMRKSRGAHLYKNGLKIEEVATELGHKNTVHTLKYLGLDKEFRRDIANKFEM